MSTKRYLWLRPKRFTARTILYWQPKRRVVSLLTPLWVLLCFTCNQAQAQVICTGEQERASALAQRIGQEWPLRSSNDQVSTYVRNLGQQLAQTVAEGQSLVWHFNVVRDRSANAFSIGNGHIYITEGAILFARNEAEIAAILAHEIGHQMAGHFCQPAQNRNTELFGGFFDWLFEGRHNEVEEQPIGSLTQVIDISMEKNADQYAVNILKTAGYDPNAMLEVARRLPKQNGMAHLQDYRRIQALESLLKGTAPRLSQESPELKQIKDRLKLE